LDYDFVNSPDLAQTFVVTCAAKNIPFRFTGLQTLKIKETDRIEAMKREMRKLGYVINDKNDNELYWDGERCKPSMELGIDTYEDHRMALAFAPYAFATDGLIINNPNVVTKSYPLFWEDIQKVGVTIQTL
jgi:3-phosphoshikimate 1-carboxyvinyltransferase